MEAMKAVFLPQYLTIADLCEMLKVNRSTIYRKTAEGNFPKPLKLGRMTRWLYSDVAKFLSEQQQQTKEGE